MGDVIYESVELARLSRSGLRCGLAFKESENVVCAGNEGNKGHVFINSEPDAMCWRFSSHFLRSFG